VLITEKGEPFGEEYTIASAVKFILERERQLGHTFTPFCCCQSFDNTGSRRYRSGTMAQRFREPPLAKSTLRNE